MKRRTGRALGVLLSVCILCTAEEFMGKQSGTEVCMALDAAADISLTGTLIGSLVPADNAFPELWAINTGLAVGDRVHGDRETVYTEVPKGLLGAEAVMTPCDAKNLGTDLAQLTAAQDMTVFVGFDSRISAIPSWADGWNAETDVLKASNDVTFRLYSTTLAKGEALTLGANGQSGGVVNYIVIAAPSGKSSVRGDVNADGSFGIADLVMTQRYILGTGTITDWKAGDLCADGRINSFDLAAMRRELLSAKSEKEYSFTVADGLFDQSATDTLGLSYPSGLETVTVWRADDTSDHYCNGVCLAAYKGRLYCQWQSSATDEDSADTHVMYSVSDDSGRTWSEPQVLADNIGSGYCTSGGWLATGDKLVAYINFWDDTLAVRGGYTYYMTTTDGDSWTSPQPVTMADGTLLSGVFEQDPHVLSSGRIVNAAHFQEGLIVCPIYTDDPSGVTGWKKGDFTATVNGTSSVEMEPSLFVQSDGTLVMIFRDQRSSYTKLTSYSYDDGVTWSEVQSTNMPDARTKQSAGNLTDGTAFMAGCPVNNSLRSPLAVTLSKDGKTFDRAYLLRSNSSDPELVYTGTAKRKGFHYCKSLVYGGSLYVGYATNKEAVEVSIVPESSLTE